MQMRTSATDHKRLFSLFSFVCGSIDFQLQYYICLRIILRRLFYPAFKGLGFFRKIYLELGKLTFKRFDFLLCPQVHPLVWWSKDESDSGAYIRYTVIPLVGNRGVVLLFLTWFGCCDLAFMQVEEHFGLGHTPRGLFLSSLYVCLFNRLSKTCEGIFRLTFLGSVPVPWSQCF